MRMLLFLLVLCSGRIIGQNPEASTKFVQLDQVEQAPVFSDCDLPDFADCSLPKITSHFIENLDEELLSSLTPEEAVVLIRFVVDTEGKILRPNIQSRSAELKAAAETIIKELPVFVPGMHEGEKVNVIINIPIKIEITDPRPLISNLYDTPAIAGSCVNKEEPKSCTGEMVQQFFFKNFQSDKFKTRGKFIKAEINFVINKEGKVTNVTAKGDNEKLNKEAISVIKNLPDFIPATKDGKRIDYVLRFPIMLQTSH